MRRARLIGDAFLWIQANDEAFSDGRVRQAYAAGPMQFYGGGPYFPGLKRADGKAAFLWPFGFGGSSTGDMAWTALALAQLYVDTRIKKYLDGAVALGEWIAAKESPYRYGGYHGGLQADGVTPQKWASTEHNIDTYALFTLLAKLTRDRRWTARAEFADALRAQHVEPGGPVPVDRHAGRRSGRGPEPDQHRQHPGGRADLGGARDGRPPVRPVAGLRHRRACGTPTPARPRSSRPASRSPAWRTARRRRRSPAPISGSDLPNNRNAVWLEGNGHAALALLSARITATGRWPSGC